MVFLCENVQLALTVSPRIATDLFIYLQELYRSEGMEKLMRTVKRWMTKLWIFVVVTVVFVYSFNLFNTCHDITLAQLVYMFLGLLFMFILQVRLLD